MHRIFDEVDERSVEIKENKPYSIQVGIKDLPETCK